MGSLQWSKAYGMGWYDYGYDVLGTADGYMLLAHMDDEYNNVYLLSIDGNGNKQWSKTYPRIGTFVGRNFEQARGGFVIAGDNRTGNVILYRTDASGGIETCPEESPADSVTTLTLPSPTHIIHTYTGGSEIGLNSSFAGAVSTDSLICAVIGIDNKSGDEDPPYPDISRESSLPELPQSFQPLDDDQVRGPVGEGFCTGQADCLRHQGTPCP